MRMPLLALLLLNFVFAVAASELTGTVLDEADKPLPRATVYLYTAAMKTGTSILCPSCYADCGKKALTDAAGGFAIKDLDPQLIFRVLVVREGYIPEFVTGVDPAKGAMSAKLLTLPKDLPSDRLVKGRVLNSINEPVVGAIVSPFGCQDGERRWWGATDDVADPLAVSNEHGEFVLVCHKSGLALDLQAEARGLATRNFPLRSAGEKLHDLVLSEGVTVVGRVLDRQGAPVAGVSVGLVQQNRRCELFTGAHEIGTGLDGRFCFSNIGPNQGHLLYGLMSSFGDRGAPAMKQVSAGDDGSTNDVGDLTIGSGHSVSGRIVLADGKPAPDGTRVLLSRDSAWDHLQADCDADGRFSFKGVPHGELVNLSARAKGYHLSSKNKSFEPMNAIFLMGIIDQDITDLRVQLDPGPAQRDDAARSGADWQRLQSTRLGGIETQ